MDRISQLSERVVHHILSSINAFHAGEMDRISKLPECIVHHILSSLNTPAELVRMSVLSKHWLDLTASFPNLVLDFNVRIFRSQESFFKYVEYTSSRFCHPNVTADKLKLIANLWEPEERDIVNRCLELVLKNGVQVLEIGITKARSLKCRLPNILLCVSVLKSLSIRGCELPSFLIVDAAKFNSLIHLTLESVHINDEEIKCLTTSCPLLQEFCIRSCHGFKRFCVYGHQNLQKVRIYYNTPVERIDIEAPNLSTLLVADTSERGAPQMNLASCKKLTTVIYTGLPLRNSNDFTDFLSNFPFLENLVLATNYKGNNLKLSSHSLRTLVLHSNCSLNDIELSTPNLVLLIYSCRYRLWPIVIDKHWPLLRDSIHLKACMQCYPDVCIDALWFFKLRLFLGNRNGYKVLNLYIHPVYSQRFMKLKKLKAIKFPPYELEHVVLEVEAYESIHVAFVDAVLWCCRPRSLTLRTSFPSIDLEEQSAVVKFTYERLLQQEVQCQTKIQIVSPSSSEAQKHLRDLKSLPMALPCKGESVTFIKEEVV